MSPTGAIQTRLSGLAIDGRASGGLPTIGTWSPMMPPRRLCAVRARPQVVLVGRRRRLGRAALRIDHVPGLVPAHAAGPAHLADRGNRAAALGLRPAQEVVEDVPVPGIVVRPREPCEIQLGPGLPGLKGLPAGVRIAGPPDLEVELGDAPGLPDASRSAGASDARAMAAVMASPIITSLSVRMMVLPFPRAGVWSSLRGADPDGRPGAHSSKVGTHRRSPWFPAGGHMQPASITTLPAAEVVASRPRSQGGPGRSPVRDRGRRGGRPPGPRARAPTR